MNIRIIAILCTALFAAGCGTSKKASRSAAPVTQPQPQRQEAPGNVPRPADNRRDYRQDHRPATLPSAGRREPVVRPEIRFTEAESEHVRRPGLNYMPGGGLTVSLDELNREFCYPLRGKFISDYGMRSGRMHTGIDIKAAPGDTIRAAFPGVVRMSKNYSGYGNIVVIRHYMGFETLYGHNSKNLVKVNDVVEAGDPIALAGRTGRATTEHLHFEVRAGGDPIDPKLVVDPNTMQLRTGWLFVSNNNGVVVASNSESGLTQAEADAFAERSTTDAARAEALAASTVDGKPKAPAEPQPVYYRVQKGDTLSAIARKHGTTVNKLCELNKIKSTALLQINQRLRVK